MTDWFWCLCRHFWLRQYWLYERRCQYQWYCLEVPHLCWLWIQCPWYVVALCIVCVIVRVCIMCGLLSVFLGVQHVTGPNKEVYLCCSRVEHKNPWQITFAIINELRCTVDMLIRFPSELLHNRKNEDKEEKQEKWSCFCTRNTGNYPAEGFCLIAQH